MRKLIHSVALGVYRVLAQLCAWLSFAARVLAVLSPHFFLLYRGDVLAPVVLTPELQALRVLMAIVLSVCFFVYFVWDALAVAGRLPKHHPGTSDADWDRAKAAMDDADPSLMGSSAWLKQRARQQAPSTDPETA